MLFPGKEVWFFLPVSLFPPAVDSYCSIACSPRVRHSFLRALCRVLQDFVDSFVVVF